MGPLILDASVLVGLLDTADGNDNRAVKDTEAADQAGREASVQARLDDRGVVPLSSPSDMHLRLRARARPEEAAGGLMGSVPAGLTGLGALRSAAQKC